MSTRESSKRGPNRGVPDRPDGPTDKLDTSLSDKYQLTLNQKVITYPSASINGRQLKALARLQDPSQYHLWQDVAGDEDKLISDDDEILLTASAADSKFFTIIHTAKAEDMMLPTSDRQHLERKNLAYDIQESDGLVYFMLRKHRLPEGRYSHREVDILFHIPRVATPTTCQTCFVLIQAPIWRTVDYRRTEQKPVTKRLTETGNTGPDIAMCGTEEPAMSERLSGEWITCLWGIAFHKQAIRTS